MLTVPGGDIMFVTAGTAFDVYRLPLKEGSGGETRVVCLIQFAAFELCMLWVGWFAEPST